MSVPLSRNNHQLESRFRSLGQRFNEELRFRDQRLRFSILSYRNNFSDWILRASTLPDPASPPNTACAIATSAIDHTTLYLAYSERWENAGARAGHRFESSNLRFVIARTDSGTKVLQFRLEWAGRRKDESGSGTLVFTGKGAGHPHWQIDLKKLQEAVGPAQEIHIEIPSPITVQEIDLNKPSSGRPRLTRLRSPLSWFHKLHLPARAMWHEQPCTMPSDAESHQHEPTTLDEIDNWVLSAIRYVRYEFSTYS